MQFTSNIQSRRTFDSSENAFARTHNANTCLILRCKYYVTHAHTSIDFDDDGDDGVVTAFANVNPLTKYASIDELDHETKHKKKNYVYMEFCDSHKLAKYFNQILNMRFFLSMHTQRKKNALLRNTI